MAKGYSEASFRQTTEAFLVALENAFWKFGGIPQTIVIDNLKAAVKHPDWYDPELQPKLRTFCEHYHQSRRTEPPSGRLGVRGS